MGPPIRGGATARIALTLALLPLVGLIGWTAPARAAMGGERSAMRNARYCEVFVVRRTWRGPDAQVYNTLGLNECPAEAWSAIDPLKLKAQFKATAIVLNGPRYFIMDRSSYTVPGEVATFGGLRMRLLAHIELSPGSLLPLPMNARHPYTEKAIRRTTQWFYDAGKPTFELTAPDGKVYVMQSYARIVDKNQSYATLASLGSHLKLPALWHYRVITPRTTLTVSTVDGVAHVLQDDYENTYQLAAARN